MKASRLSNGPIHNADAAPQGKDFFETRIIQNQDGDALAWR
jgi:hypothetical protein